jgi:hypothetical protein
MRVRRTTTATDDLVPFVLLGGGDSIGLYARGLEDFSERGSEFILRVSPKGFTPLSVFICVNRRLIIVVLTRMCADEREFTAAPRSMEAPIP